MKLHKSIISFTYILLGIFCLSSIIRSALLLPTDPFIGISPQDEKYYKLSGDVIKCKDGSKKFTRAQLNDDFCDCPDGSDEPGTSACPTGKFYCQNVGHYPLSLFSSRVNDGICDCCDGSDEYDGKVKCPNTCWEAGKVARDKLKKKIATYQEGVTLRNQEIEKAKQAITKDETDLSKLKDEKKILKDLVQQLKDRKEQIEKAEEEERLQIEKEEKAKREAEDKTISEKQSDAEEKAVSEEGKLVETNNDDTSGLLEDPPVDEDVAKNYESDVDLKHHGDSGKEGVEVDKVKQNAEDEGEASTTVHEDHPTDASDQALKPDEIPENHDLSKEELGRLVASRWVKETADQQTGEPNDAGTNDHENPEDSPDDHDEDYDEYTPDADNEEESYDNDVDDTEGRYNDDDSSSSYKYDSDDDSSFSGNPSWLEKIQQTVRSIIQAVNVFKTPVNISEAATVRKEYDESSSKLSKIESRISSLTQKLKHDFGPEKEFYSFYDRCFESKQNKYVYKVCPFKQASQMEGHSKTDLGHWDKFDDSYRVMQFSNGDKCWNGPDRSLKVKLRCGLTNEVTDVDEPSRCEYVALLSTPALCKEDKLKELQQKLEQMNKEQPHHDEL